MPSEMRPYSPRKAPKSAAALNSRPPLLVDECLAARPLLGLLQAAGYDARTSVECLGPGASDDEVFAFGKREHRVILTADCDDFIRLHEDDGDHAGLLFVYFDNDSRDMRFAEIVDAIGHAVAAAEPAGIAGSIVVLNHYRPRRS